MNLGEADSRSSTERPLSLSLPSRSSPLPPLPSSRSPSRPFGIRSIELFNSILDDTSSSFLLIFFFNSFFWPRLGDCTAGDPARLGVYCVTKRKGRKENA